MGFLNRPKVLGAVERTPKSRALVFTSYLYVAVMAKAVNGNSRIGRIVHEGVVVVASVHVRAVMTLTALASVLPVLAKRKVADLFFHHVLLDC
jgi:hypothetical protein